MISVTHEVPHHVRVSRAQREQTPLVRQVDAQLIRRARLAPERVRPAEVVQLQALLGNRTVTRLLRRSRPAPSISRVPGAAQRRVLQRYDILDKGQKAWVSRSGEGLFGLGSKLFGRSKELKAVDKAFGQWDGAKSGDAPARILALHDLEKAIKAWQGSMGFFTSGADARKLMEEVQSEIITARIEDKYGIKLDQQAGVKAIKQDYSNVPKTELDKLKPKAWTLKELQDLEKALGNYSNLLGKDRDTKALGDQPITTFSRLVSGIDEDTASGKIDTTTRGETFWSSKNISMFDVSTQNPQFAKDQNKPTEEELRKAFRGTIEHELSHALIEKAKAASGKLMREQFATDMKFWNGTPNTSTYWRLSTGGISNSGGYDCDLAETKKAADVAKVEVPITQYGMTNAGEDMAEMMKFFFEAPDKLKKDCPLRWKFLEDNIKPLLEKNVLQQPGGTDLVPAKPPEQMVV